MYFERDISGGRAFFEFERRGDRFALKRHGFRQRYTSKGFHPAQPWQATESPLIHDGSQTTLSTTTSAQNSTITGSTLAGPSGSGQFLCMVLSTVNSRQVNFASSTSGSTGSAPFYGILQNKPAISQAADIGIFGISKVVAGSTSIVAGGPIMMSTAGGSSLNGTVNAWTSASGPRIGYSLESPTAAGQVITAMIFNSFPSNVSN